jgi:hypothetical protein
VAFSEDGGRQVSLCQWRGRNCSPAPETCAEASTVSRSAGDRTGAAKEEVEGAAGADDAGRDVTGGEGVSIGCEGTPPCADVNNPGELRCCVGCTMKQRRQRQHVKRSTPVLTGGADTFVREHFAEEVTLAVVSLVCGGDRGGAVCGCEAALTGAPLSAATAARVADGGGGVLLDGGTTTATAPVDPLCMWLGSGGVALCMSEVVQVLLGLAEAAESIWWHEEVREHCEEGCRGGSVVLPLEFIIPFCLFVLLFLRAL